MENSDIVALLQQQANQYNADMRASLNQVYQYGGLAFTILGTAATLLADKGKYDVLLAIPPLSLLIWLMGIRALTELFAMGAHRHFLETRMRECLERGGAAGVFVAWDDAGGVVARQSLENVAVFAGFIALQATVMIASFITVWSKMEHSRSLIGTEIVACSLISVICVWLAIRMGKTWEKTTQLLEADRSARVANPAT